VSPPDVITEDQLDPYVQEVLNELEFIMGPVNSTFGALRASIGFPDPWTINYVEIGNEDNLGGAETSYSEYRYPAFASAITAQYPHITPISSTGDRLAETPGSATDFHQYTRPDIFVSEFDHWDNIAESDHLFLIGEYAVLEGNVADGSDVNFSAPHNPYPSWVGSVAEAVFSIGAERSSFGILGMSYAPTLQNLNSVQWTPDLISFTADPAEDVFSTSYRVIELLSNTRYTETVPVTINSNDTFGPSYWVAGTSGAGKFTFKAAVYNATETQEFSINFDGVEAGTSATLTVLTAPDGLSMNMLDGPEVVTRTVSTVVATDDGTLSFELENYSVAVLTT
jgi:alpha-N-arabinofuranosidase